MTTTNDISITIWPALETIMHDNGFSIKLNWWKKSISTRYYSKKKLINQLNIQKIELDGLSQIITKLETENKVFKPAYYELEKSRILKKKDFNRTPQDLETLRLANIILA